MLLHLPVCALRTIPEVSRLDDVLLQWARDLPLVVVVCWRRRGDGSTGEDFAGVCEDLGSPPLQLAIFGWGNAADEWLAWKQLAAWINRLL